MPSIHMTAQWVERVKPPESGRVDYLDTKLVGLGLRVSFKGTKTWFLRFRDIEGTHRHRYVLGAFPTLTLADARQQGDEILLRAKKGDDPAGEKQAHKEAPTFKLLAEDYLDRHAAKKRTCYEQRRILEKDVIPALGKKKAKDIDRRTIIALVDQIAERNAPIMANRTLNLIARVFNWGMKRALVEHNPAALVARPGKESERDRVLSPDEIRAVWKALDGEGGQVGALLKLALLTGQRRGEISAMRWEDMDLATGWWTIPADHAKNGQSHRVPLSGPAITILEALRKEQEDDEKLGKWVFPSRIGRGRAHLCTIQKHVDAIRAASGIAFWPHDLRRTVATELGMLRVSRFIIGKVLNHITAAEAGLPRVTRVYDRHLYDEEKREALEEWARRLILILAEKPGKITLLPVAADTKVKARAAKKSPSATKGRLAR